ncbi:MULTISPECIES: precorrin-6A reductase [unclassified Paenibacillus]|uniref:precorrin-6A reductase n=1 Tax=unclassified Paenibacillus TaxID=185978 RepID=UPI002405ACC4|nr:MULTISPECIES: precorrin-6A reductase [unclassified Paenibacillus]MDF9844231.1 precorrin-6A/cobalt-precorrin-6A reductase [Paenibacillus sp. PastF-2]MDF9850836.1 precorrin-6A/cobalt-precorrin-6A reductase [Paenibacillus sp. PastM-2]MDF9857401.1 precorrin-6A/cobalt-precorrin-6A reductase [Paenibacillus sp. PastF-1]MDH6482669.1 precorrin-6A/cobalt-precorrin-6A reductase [Paenibacillus sp. PastH-2]MDH6510101.1 precorrin-6A/cobalt-precorrin-6A reductase [Paenibacillus sp. PastM-3]
MILMLCGTGDARELAVSLVRLGLPLTASVVTASAAERLEEAGVSTRTGRLDREGMIALLQQERYRAVVDASHPFALEAHANAMQAAAALGLPYFRYERPGLAFDKHPLLITVHSYEEAALAAKRIKGSVMLTTGGKTLEIFAEQLLGDPEIRLTVRLLPCLDNMEKCSRLGIEQRNVIALQGPFSRDMNEALFRHYGTQVMITKESGAEGSVEEKLQAALDMGLYVILIVRPQLHCAGNGRIFDSFAELAEAVRAELAADFGRKREAAEKGEG